MQTKTITEAGPEMVQYFDIKEILMGDFPDRLIPSVEELDRRRDMHERHPIIKSPVALEPHEIDAALAADEKKLTGGSSDHYKLMVPKYPSGEMVLIDCEDVIKALKMDFFQGNLFKANWRDAAANQGNGKPGSTHVYEAEKMVHYSHKVLAHAKEVCTT